MSQIFVDIFVNNNIYSDTYLNIVLYKDVFIMNKKVLIASFVFTVLGSGKFFPVYAADASSSQTDTDFITHGMECLSHSYKGNKPFIHEGDEWSKTGEDGYKVKFISDANYERWVSRAPLTVETVVAGNINLNLCFRYLHKYNSGFQIMSFWLTDNNFKPYGFITAAFNEGEETKVTYDLTSAVSEELITNSREL